MSGRRYGCWAGQPDGVAEDTDRCVAEVHAQYGTFYQCLRRRGHGPNGEYCKQHARRLEEGKAVKVPKESSR